MAAENADIVRPGVRPTERLSAFGRDESGSNAVEFALVAAPFFGLVMLILQVGLFHFGLQSLDYAVRTAGRMVMTGQVPTTITSGAAFKQSMICPRVLWGISCSKLVVNAYRVGKTSNSGTGTGIYTYIDVKAIAMKPPQLDPSKATFCLGGPGDYIYIDVAYPYPNFVQRLLTSNAKSTVAMRSTTFVFNEPYRTASASGTC